MNNDILNMVMNLKSDGVTLSDIENELDYRESALDGMKWDDNLIDYSTWELRDIEQSWNI